MAFENQPRRSAFEFVSGSFRVTFLNGKHTGDAGVIEMPGPSAERVRVTSLERTFIDCVVCPQYAGTEAVSKCAGAVHRPIFLGNCKGRCNADRHVLRGQWDSGTTCSDQHLRISRR